MALDPATEGFLQMLASQEAKSFSDLPPPESRVAFGKLCAMTAPTTPTEVGVRDLQLDMGGRQLAARLYTPEGEGPLPVLVYYHGGGFVIGSVEDYDPVCRELCKRSGFVVLSVEYRLAPEHPFPAASDDACAALDWVAEHATEIGADAGQVVVGGDSAGGNLAAVVAQYAAGEAAIKLAGQLLIYPVTQAGVETASLRDNAEGYLLTRADMEYFLGHYVPEGTVLDDPKLSPGATQDLSGLAPAWVATCEYDPLRDDGEAYAAALQEQGVTVQSKRYNGAVHGSWNLFTVIPIGSQMLDDASAWLKSL